VEQLTITKKRKSGIADKEFELYSLILFDFGKSKLENEHKRVVDFVRRRITDGSTVTITGYTDALGEEAVNRRISTARANAVAQRLKLDNAKVEGKGEEKLIYDNSLPEGRFYCRTVQIEIVTPVKED
jgi:outer membrane protein OmpA-like peptidoglycan-associated protein